MQLRTRRDLGVSFRIIAAVCTFEIIAFISQFSFQSVAPAHFGTNKAAKVSPDPSPHTVTPPWVLGVLWPAPRWSDNDCCYDSKPNVVKLPTFYRTTLRP